VIEVGTSTWRQISGSVCRNSIRTVAISLTLSDPVFILAGLMRLVWLPALVDIVGAYGARHSGKYKNAVQPTTGVQ
jgi:hypothetical protein